MAGVAHHVRMRLEREAGRETSAYDVSKATATVSNRLASQFMDIC
jgi:hypothetical protein